MTRRTVLITGGSRGIGRGIAARLREDGYAVVTLDLEPPAQPLEGERFIRTDLSDPVETRRVLAELTGEISFGALVNNVGAVRPAPIESATLDDLNRVVALNLGAALLCTQAVLPAMKRSRFGRIVNISSRAALGKELRSVYSATKSGLHGFTRTWALELAPHGITVNAVGPGPIETELFREVNPADSPRTQALIQAIPVKRLGRPEDIAHAVASLLDERAGFITGQVIFVCGGMTIGAA